MANRRQNNNIYVTGRINPPSIAGDIGFNVGVAETTLLNVNQVTKVSTGAFITMPPGVGGLMFLRSGWASRNPVLLTGGVIDAGYTGELKLLLINVGNEPIYLEAEETIAQLVVVSIPVGAPLKVQRGLFDEIVESRHSLRGERGFGSTDDPSDLYSL